MLLIPAHAKVNLCLAVRGFRPDGYHDIDSVAVTIDWHDLVGIRLRPAATTEVRLRMAGGDSHGAVPSGHDNLAFMAAHAMAALAGPLDVDIWLDKRVPSSAGLGGGSADAAAVLRGCTSLLRRSGRDSDRTEALDEQTVLRVAASLGADVPMLVCGGAQRMRGRGDALTSLSSPALHLVAAVVGVSTTAAAYAAVRSSDLEDARRADAVAAALEAGERPDDDLLGSGLEAAACRVNRVLGERLLELRVAIPQARWHLTGSGGAAFALADGVGAAEELALAARDAGFVARACRSLSA